MDVRSRRISSTHAWSGSWSRRSKISSSGEVDVWVGTIRVGVVGLTATVLTLAAAFLGGGAFPVTSLRAMVGLCWGFSGLPVFLVAVTPGFSHASVTDWIEWLGFGLVGGVAVALTTRPPRKWFHPSSRSICSAEGPTRWAFGAAGLPIATLFRPRSGACFAMAAFASFQFTQPR